MKKQILVLMLLGYTTLSLSQSEAKSLVNQMTLEEKVNLCIGMGMNIPGIMESAPVVGQTMDKVAGAAGTTYAIPRLGIPNTVLADGPAGVRIMPTRENTPNKTYFATAFPVGTLLASTWDVNLVEQVGKAMGSEVKEYGIDVLLAPALNIQRNALNGRNFEYYSEDPLVSGEIATAMVNGIESHGVGTSIKHFAANNQETNRNLVNTIMSERALREIYLKGFEIVVKKAQPWTVMSSYNKINGVYTSQDQDLLTTILRDEWGFKGIVMTDWFGGDNAVEQMKAGNDLLMPGTKNQFESIMKALNDKTLDVKYINQNAERIVAYILQSSTYKKYKFSDKPNLMEHAKTAKQAAEEGMILLQNNENTLPLKSVNNIAVFGNISYDFISGGTGSGDVNEAYTVSLVEGLKNAGYHIDEDLAKIYQAYTISEKAKLPPKKFFFSLQDPIIEMPVSTELLIQKALDNDIAFITIGRNAGEFQDRKVDFDFNLTQAEHDLISQVSEKFHAQNKKVVLILNTGGVMEVNSWKHKVDAIILAWQGGQEGGNAVASIISGNVNPSGKLTTTFPIKWEDDVSSKNFPGKNTSEVEVKGPGGMSLGFPSEVIYQEGIFVGYRYFNTYNVKPAFEFGYGMSYTTFKYSNINLRQTSNGNFSVSIDIVNIGNVAGKEVVQLYITAPESAIKKPSAELKAFQKTTLLQPNEKQTLNFNISATDLASFYTDKASWIADAGDYIIKIGASSINIKQQIGYKLQNDIVVQKVNSVMKPKGTLIEME